MKKWYNIECASGISYFPTPYYPLNKNILFTYIYNTSWGCSVLSYLQIVPFFFFFTFFFITLQLSPTFRITFPKYIAYIVLSLTHRFLKYTAIFYLLLNKETFIFFKTEAMKQMGITVRENGKQFPEQMTKQNCTNKWGYWCGVGAFNCGSRFK